MGHNNNRPALTRRDALKLAGTSAAVAGGGNFLSIGASAQGKPTVNLQLGWLLSGNQIGEVCAKHMGFYDAEGIELKFQAGGPNIDGVAVVASGRYEVGQVSSSPSLMLAASQDLPIKCFAVGAQQHPYAFFSLKKKPIATAQRHGRQEDRHPGDRRHPAARVACQEQHPREGRADRHDRRRHDAADDRPGRRRHRRGSPTPRRST